MVEEVGEETPGRRAVSVGRVGLELALLKQTGKELHLSRGVSDLIVIVWDITTPPMQCNPPGVAWGELWMTV